MDIQEQLFYAVLDCDCRHVKELVSQGADVNHWFCYTEFERFRDSCHVVANIGHFSYLMLAIEYVRQMFYKSHKLQYGKKLKLSDWISLKQNNTSCREYRGNETTKLLALLVSLGADLNQESNCKSLRTFLSPIKLLIYRYNHSKSNSADDLAAVIKTNKVNLYSKDCQQLFDVIFDKNCQLWYANRCEIIKALVLVGYKADYSEVNNYLFVFDLPTYFLFYCIEYKKVFAFLY
jgi:hypothetical protein